jgi:hypothetical protein
MTDATRGRDHAIVFADRIERQLGEHLTGGDTVELLASAR